MPVKARCSGNYGTPCIDSKILVFPEGLLLGFPMISLCSPVKNLWRVYGIKINIIIFYLFSFKDKFALQNLPKIPGSLFVFYDHLCVQVHHFLSWCILISLCYCRKNLLLEKSSEPNLFVMQLCETDDEKEAIKSWGQTLHAMNILGFSDAEVSAICAVLAAIYHLGAAGAVIGILFLLFILSKLLRKDKSILCFTHLPASNCCMPTFADINVQRPKVCKQAAKHRGS